MDKDIFKTFDFLKVPFDTLKINGFYYKNFHVYLYKNYIFFLINEGPMFIFENIHDLIKFPNIEKKYNESLKINETIFDIKPIKNKSNFYIEKNIINEYWLNEIQAANGRRMPEIMQIVDNLLKLINFKGILYLSDWSKINGVRTIDYRLFLGLDSIYTKYGFKLVYQVPKELLKYNISDKIKHELQSLYDKKNITFHDIKRLYTSEMKEHLKKIEPYYSYMFKLFI